MPNPPITISLTDEPVRSYVEARVESGAYGTPSDYVRELILDDRDRRLARIEDQLLAAMQEEPIEVPEEVLERGDLIDFLESQLNSR